MPFLKWQIDKDEEISDGQSVGKEGMRDVTVTTEGRTVDLCNGIILHLDRVGGHTNPHVLKLHTTYTHVFTVKLIKSA